MRANIHQFIRPFLWGRPTIHGLSIQKLLEPTTAYHRLFRHIYNMKMSIIFFR